MVQCENCGALEQLRIVRHLRYRYLGRQCYNLMYETNLILNPRMSSSPYEPTYLICTAGILEELATTSIEQSLAALCVLSKKDRISSYRMNLLKPFHPSTLTDLECAHKPREEEVKSASNSRPSTIIQELSFGLNRLDHINFESPGTNTQNHEHFNLVINSAVTGTGTGTGYSEFRLLDSVM